MKKLFFYLLILIWFWPACTTQKHVQKDRTSIKTESSSLQVTETNSRSNTITTLQGFKITRITESLDTMVIDPGSFLLGEKLLADLLAGNHLMVESNDQKLDVFYDSTSGKIKASSIEKPDSIPIQFDRKTETQESTNTQTSKQQETSITEDKRTGERREVTTDHKEVELKRTYWQVWVGGAVVSLVLIAIAIWLFRLWRRKLF